MAYTLSMIANPKAPIIDQSVQARLAALFPESSIEALGENTAYQLHTADKNALNTARDAFKDLPTDINLVETGAAKRLLIADMDSTMIEQECIDELADFAGKRAEISDITERAMQGELNFEDALRERVAMLKGVSETALQETFEQKISLTPGARQLVMTMNKRGAVTALVSGGFTFFTERVAGATGFQLTQANILEVSNGVLTGGVKEPIFGRAAKLEALLKISEDSGVSPDEAIAVGDGANDLSMLERAGMGVAFHAKPAVAEAAHVRIDHGDLTALLYLQGIKQSEFALD